MARDLKELRDKLVYSVSLLHGEIEQIAQWIDSCAIKGRTNGAQGLTLSALAEIMRVQAIQAQMSVDYLDAMAEAQSHPEIIGKVVGCGKSVAGVDNGA